MKFYTTVCKANMVYLDKILERKSVPQLVQYIFSSAYFWGFINCMQTYIVCSSNQCWSQRQKIVTHYPSFTTHWNSSSELNRVVFSLNFLLVEPTWGRCGLWPWDSSGCWWGSGRDNTSLVALPLCVGRFWYCSYGQPSACSSSCGILLPCWVYCW